MRCDKKNKELTFFQMVISFVCLLSQCLFLLSGTEILSTRLTNSIGPVGLKRRYETFPDSKFIS